MAAGFTLLELLIVLAVLAVLATGATALHATNRAALHVRQVADTLVTDLRRLRQFSISTGQRQELLIDREGHSYAMPAFASRSRHAGETVRLNYRPAFPDLTGADPGPLVFLPNGTSSGGMIHVSGNGRAAEVTIEWLTGRIKARNLQ